LRHIIEQYGSDSIAYYLGTAVSFDSAGYAATNAFFEALDTKQRYSCATIDTVSKFLVSELMSGFPGLHPIVDTLDCKLLLLLGTNPMVSHGHLNGFADPARYLRAIEKRGELWVADPRATRTAKLASEHLALQPGSDYALLAHLVKSILADGIDKQYVAQYCRSEDILILTRAVEAFTLQRTCEQTGLQAPQINKLLKSIRKNGKVAVLTGTGCTMTSNANLTDWLAWCLQIITGTFERQGGMWFNPGLTMGLNKIPVFPVGDAIPEPGPKTRPELPRFRGEYSCAALIDEIEAGNIRAMVIPGGNPLPAFPDSKRTIAALKNLDVLLVADVVENEITDLATHIWPCQGQLERSDVNPLMEIYRIAVAGQYTPAVMSSEGDRSPLWWWYAKLAEQLDLTFFPNAQQADKISNDDYIAATVMPNAEILAQLKAEPTALVTDWRVEPWVENSVIPDGKWRLTPTGLVEQMNNNLEQTTTMQLKLIPGRQVHTLNSQLRDIHATGRVSVKIHINDKYAESASIEQGQIITVRSDHGQLKGIAEISEDIIAGAVWIPHGWMETNVCQLTSHSEDIDQLSGMVTQSAIPVTIEVD